MSKVGYESEQKVVGKKIVGAIQQLQSQVEEMRQRQTEAMGSIQEQEKGHRSEVS